MNLFNLDGMSALVVGGSGDIGQAMSEALIEAGVDKLEIIDIKMPDAQWLSSISNSFSDIGFIQADISSIEQVQTSFKEALDRMDGKIDILINAAGIQRRHLAVDFPFDEWNEVIDVNLTAVFAYTKLAANEMIKRKFGKIISIGSIMGQLGGSNIIAYAAAKGGVAQLSRAFCSDISKHGININTIAPGYIETELNTNLYGNTARMAEISARIPQGRWGKPADLRGITVFLASHASDYVNGVVVPVDGGYLSR